MLNASFRTKVLVPVIVVMALLVAATVFIVNQRITRQFLAEAKNNLATANAVFLNSQTNHQNELLLRFGNLPNQPLWHSLFSVGYDSPTLEKDFQEFLNEPGVDIVFYSTNATGIIVTTTRKNVVSAAAFQTAAIPAVKQALQGQKSVDVVRAGNSLFDVVSIPVFLDQEVIGALTIGSEIGNADAQEFSKLTHAQIALLAGGNIVGLSLTNSDANEQFINLFENISPANTEPSAIILNGEHYFGTAGKIESLNGDDSLGYVLLSSYQDSFQALQATQQRLLLFSLCAVLLSAAVIWFLVSRVTRPLLELRDSAEAVGRGDFSRRVAVRSNDECGQLAGAFNQMTGNIQQSRAQLEQTVETLKTTQAQLVQSEKLSAVGEFVAGVAHELNNPLAAVMGFSEMLKDADVDETHRKHLNLIFKAAQRCQKIVQSLLSFARRQKPERKPVSVNSLVEAVLEIVAYPLRTSNVEVETHFDKNLPHVLADEHQIQQVMLNIISNARQAIEAHQPGGKIKIVTEACEPNIRITISDNGPGISPENLRKIFDPFFTTKEVGKGTGLGLSLCYGLIKEHGVNIIPMSKPGEGATFVIELPIARGVDVSKPSPPEANKFEPREGAGKKILVVDDEEPLLQMVQEILTRCGYHVHTMADGETALRELNGNIYDAIFLDWKMPGLNGRQTYERIRETKPELCSRVIFITGDVINEQMQQFLKTENRPCLTKPFALAELRHVIKSVLTR